MNRRMAYGFFIGLIVVMGWVCWGWYTTGRITDQTVDELLAQHPLRHLGAILDGNRRWARRHGYKPWIGHEKGVTPVRTAVTFCIEHKIPFLTLYVFSLENLQRSPEELNYLFDVLAHEVAAREFQELVANGVRVTVIGDRSAMPERLLPILDDLVEKTAQNDKLNLQLLFCYGGVQEIVAAVRSCCDEARRGEVPEKVDVAWFERHLWSHGLPPVDLVIRTGGQTRLSNFLLFKAAYSDLYVLDCYWPDLTEQHLARAVEYYANCRRTFGK